MFFFHKLLVQLKIRNCFVKIDINKNLHDVKTRKKFQTIISIVHAIFYFKIFGYVFFRL